jgi:hypothetical protein
MEAKGLHGQVELLQDKVQLRRNGLLAKAKGRDKEIPDRRFPSTQQAHLRVFVSIGRLCYSSFFSPVCGGLPL